MKNSRYISFGLLLIFQLGVLAMSMYIDSLTSSNDLGGLFNISKYSYIFKYISFIGIGLVIYNFIVIYLDLRHDQKNKEKLEHELNTLKAKLFDLQEAAKKEMSAIKPSEKA